MSPDDAVDVTAILAQPREFLQRYESVLAKLEQAQAELDKRSEAQMQLQMALHVVVQERNAAHDELARLQAELREYKYQRDQNREAADRAEAELGEWSSGRRTYVSPAELQAMIERRDQSLKDDGIFDPKDEIDAALRGEPAPATWRE